MAGVSNLLVKSAFLLKNLLTRTKKAFRFLDETSFEVRIPKFVIVQIKMCKAYYNYTLCIFRGFSGFNNTYLG